jgi:L-ascorbate metabolism protein UlaG (beta-lactamase superfamily)
MTSYYLKQNVAVNPLLNQWYVTLPIATPVVYALRLVKIQIPIMESYISNPTLHQDASKRTEMLGGPFVNYADDKSVEMNQLLTHIKTKHNHLLTLAQGILTLDIFLKQQAHGASLEPLYAEIPPSLKGYVELVYDINSNPSIRFIESMLYKSSYTLSAMQAISLSVIHSDHRPFVLSTPVLATPNNWQLDLPFSSHKIDQLFSLRSTPKSKNEIVDKLELSQNVDHIISNYFYSAENFIKKPHPFERNAVRIRYFGHACLLIETKVISILIDPFISYDYPTELERFTYNDLPEKIDFILITHAHLDHLVLETLLQLRHKADTILVPKASGNSIIDPSLKLLLNDLGFSRVREIDELEEINITDGRIISIPFLGEHHDLNIKAKTTYLISLLGRSFLIATDANNLSPDLYQHIHKLYGDIEHVFIGMECHGAPLNWFYGHLLSQPMRQEDNLSRRGSSSNCLRARQLVKSIQAKHIYIYAMGLEPWTTYMLGLNLNKHSIQAQEVQQFIDQCQQDGLHSEQLFLKKELIFESE